jgi:RNA polymerase sigma-70 factor (ECF subfamily)
MALAELFSRHVDVGTASPEALELKLAELHAAGRRAWPAIELDAQAYVRHLAAAFVSAGCGVAGLDDLFAADLYLACACTAADPAALAELDRQFITPLVGYLARRDALATFGDDIKQMVRERLLVAGEGMPRIAMYAGQGPLKTWLRMAAVRVAIGIRRTTERSRADRLVGAAEPPDTAAPDIEGKLLKARYGDDFRAALEDTLARLPKREGSVLRLHYLEGMTGDQIAALYRVSRRTVHRWLTDGQSRILEGMRRRLRRRLALSTAQMDTLLRLLRTEMTAGVQRLAGKAKP